MPSDFAARVVPAARKRLDRAAIFTFALTAMAAGGCNFAVDGGRANDDAGIAAMYGAPAIDAGPNADGGRDASVKDGAVDDDGSPVAMYGLPQPVDAGDADAFFDSGAIGVMYGVARWDASTDDADTDAGPPDDGGTQALYGLPPSFDGG